MIQNKVMGPRHRQCNKEEEFKDTNLKICMWPGIPHTKKNRLRMTAIKNFSRLNY